MVAASGGTEPTTLHPLAVAAISEGGVEISRHQVKHVDVFTGQSFDRVVTVCDRAREACLEPPTAGTGAHWRVPNPAEAHPSDLEAFRATARELHARARYLLPVLALPDHAISDEQSLVDLSLPKTIGRVRRREARMPSGRQIRPSRIA
jgi:protein-tyrosine-phosphatase